MAQNADLAAIQNGHVRNEDVPVPTPADTDRRPQSAEMRAMRDHIARLERRLEQMPNRTAIDNLTRLASNMQEQMQMMQEQMQRMQRMPEPSAPEPYVAAPEVPARQDTRINDVGNLLAYEGGRILGGVLRDTVGCVREMHTYYRRENQVNQHRDMAAITNDRFGPLPNGNGGGRPRR